jgi:hypothetical protein
MAGMLSHASWPGAGAGGWGAAAFAGDAVVGVVALDGAVVGGDGDVVVGAFAVVTAVTVVGTGVDAVVVGAAAATVLKRGAALAGPGQLTSAKSDPATTQAATG